jgi:rRNA-processing protein FCF1
MKTKVILDTNALLMPFQFGINLTSELDRLLGQCEVYVPSSVLKELKKLKPAKMAREGESMAARFEVFETDETGDQAIVAVAEELKCVVVTNDKELIKILKERNIPVVYLRSRTHLELSGSFL